MRRGRRCDLLAAAGRASKGLELACRLDARRAARACAATPTRLRQVLTNLLGQRRQVHRARRGRVLRACSEPDDAAGDASIRLRGARHRHRHPPQARSAALPAVQRRPTARPRARFGGTGLGLAISRRLAELMGGEHAASSSDAGPGLDLLRSRLPRRRRPRRRRTAQHRRHAAGAGRRARAGRRRRRRESRASSRCVACRARRPRRVSTATATEALRLRRRPPREAGRSASCSTGMHMPRSDRT
ncbi:MAG: hypothetical protein MZW92_23485 [Comamonadaceae bacterium]|nr:hypothetical protein [Comamonadaceae bacterium]